MTNDKTFKLSVENLETIVQSITEGILLLDRNLKIVWANKAFFEQSKYK
ncbi:PAS domain-containing protein, partial [Candidatus Saganbacteria bacterium]|nr:PAS domain-containing protein [Candidatus Saganbacteria bacterium]